MLQFDPNDPEEMAFTLKKAVKKSGLTLTDHTTPGTRLRREVNSKRIKPRNHSRHDPVSAGVAGTGGLWGE